MNYNNSNIWTDKNQYKCNQNQKKIEIFFYYIFEYNYY